MLTVRGMKHECNIKIDCTIDNPPTSCSVEETRDCDDGKCICKHTTFADVGASLTTMPVTAIANYTVRVAETSLSSTQRQEALKFIGKRRICW